VPLGGGTSVVLASGLSQPNGIAVDASFVYFTCDGDRTVRKVPIGGGAPVVLATAQGAPSGIALDDTAVYWTSQSGGTVMRLAK
jgi:sugar lactone lactonase YvrE